MSGAGYAVRMLGRRILEVPAADGGSADVVDVTKVYVDAQNQGHDPYELLEETLPAAERLQLRMSGAAFDVSTEAWQASRCHSIPEAVLELYRFVLEIAFHKVELVTVERERASYEDDERQEEFRAVREIAEGVAAIA
jgi:uncharacterized protein (UPF0276 family)